MEGKRQKRSFSSRLPRNNSVAWQQPGCQRLKGPIIHHRYELYVQDESTHSHELRLRRSLPLPHQ